MSFGVKTAKEKLTGISYTCNTINMRYTVINYFIWYIAVLMFRLV